VSLLTDPEILSMQWILALTAAAEPIEEDDEDDDRGETPVHDDRTSSVEDSFQASSKRISQHSFFSTCTPTALSSHSAVVFHSSINSPH
jgi:hypothetical protein